MKANNVFDIDPYSLKKAKEGPELYVKVLFEDGKAYSYFCRFRVMLGDYVFVEGKQAGKLGKITEFIVKRPSDKVLCNTMKVTEAFKSPGINSLSQFPMNKSSRMCIWSEIEFGRFRQGTSEVKRPLNWYVIKRDRNQLTLLCKNAVRSIQYNNSRNDVTWDNCSLRDYLNNAFLQSAFNEEEKESIINLPLDSVTGTGKTFVVSNKTRDKVFLLDNETAETLPADIKICYPTKRAIEENSMFVGRNLSSENYIYWWLRNPGWGKKSASIMGGYGITKQPVDTDTGGLRPVIVVNLNSRLFGGSYEEVEIPSVFTDEEKQKQESPQKEINNDQLLKLKNEFEYNPDTGALILGKGISVLNADDLRLFKGMKSVIIRNSMCSVSGNVKKQCGENFELKYDINQEIKEYLNTCSDHAGERERFIRQYIQCIEEIKQTPDELWVDDQYKLLLLTDMTVWQTEIETIGDDMEIVDDILTGFFGMRKVVGVIKYCHSFGELVFRSLEKFADTGEEHENQE